MVSCSGIALVLVLVVARAGDLHRDERDVAERREVRGLAGREGDDLAGADVAPRHARPSADDRGDFRGDLVMVAALAVALAVTLHRDLDGVGSVQRGLEVADEPASEHGIEVVDPHTTAARSACRYSSYAV